MRCVGGTNPEPHPFCPVTFFLVTDAMAQDVQWTPSISPVNDCRPQSSDICVLHWNVLASPGATTKLYPYCPAATLRTDLRSPRLVRFVQTLAPDILLLNEYEPNYHSAALAAAGYDSHFLRRTGGKVDGEAVCWDRHRYCIQEHWDVCYDDLVLEQPGSPEAANQLRTGYVGLVVRLLDLSDGARTLLVATTHLCWGSDKVFVWARTPPAPPPPPPPRDRGQRQQSTPKAQSTQTWNTECTPRPEPRTQAAK